jgi:hypothetical protein
LYRKNNDSLRTSLLVENQRDDAELLLSRAMKLEEG